MMISVIKHFKLIGLCALSLAQIALAEQTQVLGADSPNSTESATPKEKVRLNKITAVSSVNADLEKFQSGESLNRKMLDSNPSGNGDITSILRILPNVQYDNAQMRSTTPGEIDPANISISGGLFYQNNFQLDGFNMNNDLDPAGSNGSNPVDITALPGRSQGLSIDTSLLESIKVQDSNIGAAYGGFTGGVVEANTRRATKKFGAKISYQVTQGNAAPGAFSMTNYHIYAPNAQSYENFLNSTSAGSQPNFIKHILRSSFESKINDRSGVIASFTTTQSFIPLNAYTGTQIDSTLDSSRKTQKRQSYNFFLKGYYDFGESLRVEASYAYVPSYNQYFIVNTKDSDFNLQSGGHQAGLKTMWENRLGLLSVNANFNFLENSRSGSAQHMKGWRYSADKNWNPNGSNGEGGYGNVDTRQINFTLKAIQDFEPLTLFSFWENKFNAGAEVGYVNAYYRRYEDTIFSGSAFTRPMAQGEICTDTEWCSNAPVYTNGLPASWADNNGQYIYRGTLYKAGKINVDNATAALFVEDSMKFSMGRAGDINMRLGLRLDYDTYMGKAPIAPRFSLNYIAPWSEWESGRNFATQLSFGANRYYGRNLFTYALMDGRSALEYELSRFDPTTPLETDAVQYKNDTNFSKLRVPYSDELMAGVVQRIYMFNLGAKYIHRFGRDEIRRGCFDPNGNLSALNCRSNSPGLTSDLRFAYINEGRSDSDIITLSLQQNEALEFWRVKNYVLFAFDWTNVKRNYADYADNLTSAQLANQWISYDGQLIRYADRPADNYVRPYTFRLTTTHNIDFGKVRLLWNNFFRYRSSYVVMASTSEANRDQFDTNGDGVLEPVDTFKPFNVRGAFTWDMRFGFDINIAGQNTLFVNLDIFNVLDNRNMAVYNLTSTIGSANFSAVPVYEVGRQFWVEVGYKY
ncbi:MULTISPECIES: TonB-dependent receptor plug domain-containing protein [unclassified Helicobacter]|uniref:TonB-dependent receptor plug domain-containing protein n=1 Tax=unclassified Helicobacter TaxID=2593540 RepID=UPI002163643D|nr:MULTISPECIES: TonB-dependent receptor plug domain-containing protein [unclassified Helicobacter]